MSFSTVILAGGKSSRMGRDKAFLEMDGQSLLKRQIKIARASGALDILISGRAEVDYSSFGLRVVQDHFPDAGPLAGIHAALILSPHPRLLVLAVDLTEMTAVFLRNLAEAAEVNGIIPRIAGEIEPLAAFYPCSARDIIGNMLAGNDRSVRGFAHACVMAGLATYADLPNHFKPLFKNLNSPSDLPAER